MHTNIKYTYFNHKQVKKKKNEMQELNIWRIYFQLKDNPYEHTIIIFVSKCFRLIKSKCHKILFAIISNKKLKMYVIHNKMPL